MHTNLYDEINQTEIENRQGVNLAEMINEAIQKHPDNIAIYDYGRTLTYRELGVKSHSAAVTVKSLAKRNECVAIAMERGCDMIIAALAVIKSGCVYVPIDINYPTSRIKYMLQNSNCSLVITDAKHKKIMNDLKDGREVVICFDDLLQYENIISESVEIDENEIAYIIYTSGTTGRPKGAMISHKAILNTLFWMGRYFNICCDDIISHRTSISFTDSIFEIFLPLMFGAGIQIINDNDAKEMRRLYIMLEKVTMMQCVPSLLKIFLDYLERKEIHHPLPKLKWIFNSGEHISSYLAKKFNKLFYNAMIANTYGMTESAIYASCYIIGKDFDNNRVPIGKPIDNTKIFIYDNNKLCDIGQIGEIYISGTGIAAGYLNMPLTAAEKFCYRNNYRCYKTGDLGAIREDGNIDYHGRIDDQIKIHGNRVEMEEVEKNILEHISAGDIAVISDVDQFGDNYLICFYTNKSEDITEIRKKLSLFLPDYMLPRDYTYIEVIPTNQHDKIDKEELRRKLREHKNTFDYLVNVISGIWKILLPETEFNIDTDFFDIGGDSMLALKLKSMLDIIEIDIEYSKIKANSTIKSLAELAARKDYLP